MDKNRKLVTSIMIGSLICLLIIFVPVLGILVLGPDKGYYLGDIIVYD